jgi:hypothetical protein
MSLANQFAAYTPGAHSVQRPWPVSDMADAERIVRRANRSAPDQLQERLREDRLNVAFVAEFSRGKSELINAIFFADYGDRMLPSSAGRTTMCPTELLYDAGQTARHRIAAHPDAGLAFRHYRIQALSGRMDGAAA